MAMVEFSLATGLRESNVTQLEWNQVDLQRKVAWIHADQSKSRKPFGVPLNSDAIRVLTAERGKHAERVFTFNGNPVQKANTKAWRNALKELGGWSDISMALKYAHLSPEHLASHAENICIKAVPRSNIARFPAHPVNELRRS